MTKREFMMQYVLAQAGSDRNEPVNPADSARDAELAYIHIDKAAPRDEALKFPGPSGMMNVRTREELRG
jgi:hypothetical protein